MFPNPDLTNLQKIVARYLQSLEVVDFDHRQTSGSVCNCLNVANGEHEANQERELHDGVGHYCSDNTVRSSSPDSLNLST